MSLVVNFEYQEKCWSNKDRVCVVCDSEDNVVVHHKDGNRSNQDLDNLIPLCQSCHDKVHYRGVNVSDKIQRFRDALPEKSFWDATPPTRSDIDESGDYNATTVSIGVDQYGRMKEANKKIAPYLRSLIDECIDSKRLPRAKPPKGEQRIHKFAVRPEQQRWARDNDVNLSALLRAKIESDMEGFANA